MRKLENQGRWVLPGLWQLNRTTWIARVQPRDPRTGKRVNRRRLITNATRSEAIAVLERLRREAEQPNPAAPSLPAAPSMAINSHAQTTSKTAQPTLGDFIESWLERKIARGDLEETTATRYATDLGHLSKRLLRMRLDEIQPNDIELWMVAARKEGFAPSTINTWLAILRSALNDAPGLLSNPATRVDPLKKPVNLEEPNSLKPEQLRKLLEALREEDRVVCAAAWTQAVTGLRWCEVTALKWEDLDRQERILVIRRKAVKGKLKPSTKTRRLRELGVPELIIEELAGLRAWLSATEHPGRESGLMFPSRVGTPLASSRISEALRAARKRAAITQRFTSHGLRRSMTDMLRRAKVDPVIAKAIVGHQTDAMREHYSTLASDEARQAADAVSAMLFGSSTTGASALPADSAAN
jgi:integrase